MSYMFVRNQVIKVNPNPDRTALASIRMFSVKMLGLKRIVFAYCFLVLVGFQLDPSAFVKSGSIWNTASAQTTMDIHDPIHHYLRFVVSQKGLNDLPSYNLRPTPIPNYLSIEELLPEIHPWMNHAAILDRTDSNSRSDSHYFTFYTPEMRVTHNNYFAWGQNDGALWQGRGLNQSFTMGVGVEVGPVQMVLRPNFVYSENRDFMINPVPARRGLSEYAVARLYLDMPDRFGPDPISQMDLGNSYIRAGYKNWVVGFSNEHIWAGPAVYNPLLFSNNAPGFLHTFIGTQSPQAIPSGRVETRWFWGGLRESEYFDSNPSNNLRYVTGFVINYSPDIAPGLHVGYNRVAYKYYPKDGLSLGDVFLSMQRLQKRSNTQTAQLDFNEQRFTMSSAFIRYVMPESGIEWYLEWGRNDYQRKLRDFFSEPELNRGYTSGIIKRFELPANKLLTATVELTQLENNSPGALHRTSNQLTNNDANIWYMNNYIRQGYTHRGQVIGAGIGPGSSAQTLNLTFYDKWGSLGATIGRTVYHNDRLYYFWSYYSEIQPFAWNTLRKLHEVEISYGVQALLFLPYNMELQLEYRLGSYENRHNIMNYDVKNTNLSATVRYALRRVRF